MNHPPVPQPKKKGLHPLAWVAIGCAGILVVAGVVAVIAGMFVFQKAREMADNPALTLAKLIDAANPEIEIASQDEANRTVTFRNVQTGEEITVSYQDIEEGRVSFTSEGETASIDLDTASENEGSLTIRSGEGTATFGAAARAEDFPAWLPVYPGSAPRGTFSSKSANASSGAYTTTTADDLDAVIDFYAGGLEQAGLEIKSRTTTANGAILVAADSGEVRSAMVTLARESGQTQVMVNFTEKTH